MNPERPDATPTPAQLHPEERRRLFGLAYRMLGDVGDAEDAVAEAFARLVATTGVEDPRAWLTTVVTNISIDRLRSAQRQRETYVGPWLPEPLLVDPDDPADLATDADSLTLTFLVVLERLSPQERAVFLLHEVFGYPHAEIAGMLGRSHDAVRKLASRARRHLDEARPRYDDDADRRRDIATAFLDACQGGDLDTLLSLLSPAVVLTGDGGGVVTAARQPVVGRENVARMLLGLTRLASGGGWSVVRTDINTEPGLIASLDGVVQTALVLHIEDGVVSSIQNVRNPAKLARLQPGSRADR